MITLVGRDMETPLYIRFRILPIPFRGSVRMSVSSEQREMGHEARRGGGGQDQGTSSLVKNRTAEGPTLSKTKGERVGHPRIVSRAIGDARAPGAAYDAQPFLQGDLPACLASKCDAYIILLRLGISRNHLQPALWKHSAVALEKKGP